MKRIPTRLKWTRCDVPDGGVIDLLDQDGYVIASVECPRDRWRSSDEARALRDIIVACQPRPHRDEEGRGDG